MRLFDWISSLWRKPSTTKDSERGSGRGVTTHVVILDGTASSLEPGYETNAGLTYQLLKRQGPRSDLTVYYEQGIQWYGWRNTWDVLTGRGINRQIQRAYGALASRYHVGDEIVFVGYSRGAYAVRSLAGVIDMMGLIKSEHATERAVATAYRHYRVDPKADAARQFRQSYCHETVPIKAVAVWDTVKALGVRLPGIWRYSMRNHAFHNHALGPSVENGFHALAHDETRVAYAPVMWLCAADWPGKMEQVWFKGTHSDIGGQIEGHADRRPLANIPLVWMLDRLESCGVPLPLEWQDNFPQDINAPSKGAWSGWAKLFWHRRRRIVGACRSERLHESLLESHEPENFNVVGAAKT